MAFGGHNPSHIALRYRKVLTSKLLYFDGEPVLYDFDAPAFFRHLELHSVDALRDSPADEALDDYFRVRFKTRMETAFPYTSPDNPFHFLHTALSSISCKKCANSRPVCSEKNFLSDSENVRDLGLCVEPLHRFFSVSMQVAQYYYNRYAPGSTHTVHFNTEHSSKDSLHDIPVPYMVDGRTELFNDSSTVVLTLNSILFDQDSFYAILYVLFHECICHAFQRSIRENSDVRVSCGKDDYFGEGWMDHVAWTILHDFLTGKTEALADQLARVPKTSRLLHVCRTFHEERCNYKAKKPCDMARVHYTGEKTAEMMQSFLLDLEVPEPEEVFYRLTFALNTAQLTREARMLFMETLLELQNIYFPTGQRQDYFPTGQGQDHFRFEPAFREFAETFDFPTLLAKVLPREVLAPCIFI